MKGYRLVLLAFIFIPLAVNAQYWFQSGARGGQDSTFNSGAKATIQTINDPNLTSGSLAFWVGETLDNVAFIQAGYTIFNASGYYPTQCNVSGCFDREYIQKGAPEWFYEYFLPGTTAGFTGAIGPDNSAGINGSFHTYGFVSDGSRWNIFVDNTPVGSINLGSNNSGYNDAVAFAEVANVSGAIDRLPPTIFSNLSVYKDGKFLPIPDGYSYVGYGTGSSTSIPNVYGVSEIDGRVNYFQVGSNVTPRGSGQQLWQLGYYLHIISAYGNLSDFSQYIAYATVNLHAPRFISINNGTRTTFNEWIGNGDGSYSGTSNKYNITLFGNVNETANYSLQYLLRLNSQYGNLSGGGWHDANGTVNYSVSPAIINLTQGSRLKFISWSNGQDNSSANLTLSGPFLLNATWIKQYLINASSDYGNVSGSGWYYSNTTASLKVLNSYKAINQKQRYAFYSWSNGDTSPNITVYANTPASLRAVFRNQSLATLQGTDQYGLPIQAGPFYIGGIPVNDTSFLYNNYNYNIDKAYYKGAMLSINQNVNVNSPGTVEVILPVYNTQIKTSDIFGVPVNISVTMAFVNGTTGIAYSGSQGVIDLNDVPYGEVNVTSSYAGFVLTSNAKNGTVARISVISYVDVALFIGIIVLGFVMYFAISRRHSHRD